MTRSWSLVAGLSLVLFLMGLFLKNGALLALALPYLLFTLVSFWRPRPETRWRLEGNIEPGQIQGDQPGQVTLFLTIEGKALEDVSMTDEIPPGLKVGGNPYQHGGFGAGQTQTLSYKVTGVRGRYEFPGLRVRVSDLLGLYGKEEFLPWPRTLTVLPKGERVKKIKISPRRTRVYTGVIRSRESGPGVEFFGTRAYVPGDPLRHLNWKAGARWDLLITNLFEQERAADVGIILDARKRTEVRANGESLFERSVRAALSLADYFLDEGNRVGLLIYGRFLEWTFPGYGKRQSAKILAALTQAEPGDHPVFQEFKRLPTRLFPPQSQLVFVSPLLQEDVHPLRYLRAMGYRVLVLSPDPIAFEKRLLPEDEITAVAERMLRFERQAILARLLRAGVRMVEWDPSEPLRVSLERSFKGTKR